MSETSSIQKVRPTIGYLAPHIDDSTGYAIWSGVASAARKRDVNLICFVGERLGQVGGLPSPANVLYDLVDVTRLDGVITWSSTLGGLLNHDENRRFHERYQAVPLVTIAEPFAGIPSVVIDGYPGMREAMVHLIETHGYRRLAFIRGPEDHYYAQERYQAYTETLAEYGIPFDPALVTPPNDFSRPSGRKAIRLLLDERKLRPQVDVEAVVGASDLFALGALEGLQSRGVQVPGDVAVVGFNDSVDCRCAAPPLTSVAVPFYKQGSQAMEMLLAWLGGEQVPEQVILPSELVVRQSCGCSSRTISLAWVEGRGRSDNQVVSNGQPPAQTLQRFLASQRANLLSEMLQVLGGKEIEPEWAEQLLDAFLAELNGESPGFFLSSLVTILHQATAVGDYATAWQRALSVLRRNISPCLNDDVTLLRAENLWHQARVMIGQVARRNQMSLRLQTEQQAQMLREISQALVTRFDLAELMDVLARRLPDLGISACYLSLYEEPNAPTEWANLILAYDERGPIELQSGGQRFRSRQLAPEDLLPGEKRYTMVVKPLYYQKEQLGFVLFKGGEEVSRVYEALSKQISGALKGVQLFKHNVELYNEAQQARTVAEKADQLKTRLLANVSHELRNPLDIILRYTQAVLNEPHSANLDLSPTMLDNLTRIHHNAEHLRRVIGDLLDLSRAEIGELDLSLQFVNPRDFLADVFHNMAPSIGSPSEVSWRLQLPDHMPPIQVDPVRLRQVLFNLLDNARKFTERGQIVLGAEVTPPHLHLWVQDTGTGIPANLHERIFEPFVAVENVSRQMKGIGLGLSIARRLVALHRGLMALDSQPDQGSTFHVYLPLSVSSDRLIAPSRTTPPVLLLVSSRDQPPAEIAKLSQRLGLEIRKLQAGDNVDAILAQVQPAALAWDFAEANPGDRVMIRQLHENPLLRQIPLFLYDQDKGSETASTTVTNLVIKPVSSETLMGAISALSSPEVAGPILIVDDDPEIRDNYRDMVAKSLPSYPIRTASDGVAALEVMAEETPSLVVLDLVMPKMDGFEVLERMRANKQTRYVPVLVLSGRVLTLEDVERLEQHTQVTLQSKGILSETETVAALQQVLLGDNLPTYTSALVKRVIAYFHQNYDRPLTRREIAGAVGANKDYLGQVFRQELGLSPWEYLNRYRIGQAKVLLRDTDYPVSIVAYQVGFNDPSYFGRVFHKHVGLSPRAYRKNPHKQITTE